jgi:hypothetical protein
MVSFGVCIWLLIDWVDIQVVLVKVLPLWWRLANCYGWQLLLSAICPSHLGFLLQIIEGIVQSIGSYVL